MKTLSKNFMVTDERPASRFRLETSEVASFSELVALLADDDGGPTFLLWMLIIMISRSVGEIFELWKLGGSRGLRS